MDHLGITKIINNTLNTAANLVFYTTVFSFYSLKSTQRIWIPRQIICMFFAIGWGLEPNIWIKDVKYPILYNRHHDFPMFCPCSSSDDDFQSFWCHFRAHQSADICCGFLVNIPAVIFVGNHSNMHFTFSVISSLILLWE